MTHTDQQIEIAFVDRILDRDAALAFVGHDHDFLHELLDAFQDYRLGMIERIEKAIRDENARELREVAHQLKGALGNFHARAAVTTARQLEDVGRQGSLQNAAPLCETLSQELDVLCNSVTTLLQELQQTD